MSAFAAIGRFLAAGDDSVTVEQGGAGAERWLAADDYDGAFEVLADQSGAGAVLTFTFAQAVVLVMVESVGAFTSRVVVGTGQTPTATLGIRVNDEKVFLPAPVGTTVVRVFAPIGTTVNAAGWER